MSTRLRPMRPYRASDLPVLCADCGGRLVRSADGIVWRHVDREPEVDHAPHVAGTVQR